LAHNWKSLLVLAVLCMALLASTATGVSNAAGSSRVGLEPASQPAQAPNTSGAEVPLPPEETAPATPLPDDNSAGQQAPSLQARPSSPPSNVGTGEVPPPTPSSEPPLPDNNTDAEVRPAAPQSPAEVQADAATDSTAFPATGDEINVADAPYWWNAGDYAQGTRTLNISSVSAVRYNLVFTENALNTTGHLDLELSINGTVVGSLSIVPGETSKSGAFFFPPISAPSYVIRLEETNTVDSGAGSVAIALDSSSLTFYNSTTSLFPGTGDTFTMAFKPFWYNVGDRVEATRTIGFDNVVGVQYNLILKQNTLNSGGQVDLDLSINGTVVGSFTFVEGEMAKSLTAFFPPISGPTYTIRLEETNNVHSGGGSVVLQLDSSLLKFFSSTSSWFPATGDEVNVVANPYWWQLGDHAQGTRTPGLDFVTGVQLDLQSNHNALSSIGHVDLDLSINGTVVGSFSIVQGETAKPVSFFFPPISGPDYIVRLETTNQVDPGAGSVSIPLDTSILTFYDSTSSPFLPATGDAVHVLNDPFWWKVGDYAEGTRITRFKSVSGIRYELVLSRNTMKETGHVDLDLSINGTVVTSFSILPGEMFKSGFATFPPISGPTYVVRLEETNEVDPGLGSIVIPLDQSLLQFRTSLFVPLVVK